ncbi:hypothetical protein Ct61P_08730 [Colletotrichum tofieldiae]|nr:hypothetical protein Ct61P_08730 [Colletotrichum tofieldiae]
MFFVQFRITVWFKLSYKLVFILLIFFQRQPTRIIWKDWSHKEPRGVVLDLQDEHCTRQHEYHPRRLGAPPSLTQPNKMNLRMEKKLDLISVFRIGTLQVFPVAEGRLCVEWPRR